MEQSNIIDTVPVLKKIYFCPRCHVRIKVPDFVGKCNVKGNINIVCGNCKKGVIKING